MDSEPVRKRLRSGIEVVNGITGETRPVYQEYVLAEDYDALRAEVAALKAELAKYTEPLTDEQARAVLLVESTRPNHSAEEIVKQWDDDIREVRSK